MDFWVAFAGGLVVGWLAEWVVDWLFWRRGVEAYYATEDELRRQVDSLAAENESLRQQLAARPNEEIRKAKAEKAELESK